MDWRKMMLVMIALMSCFVCSALPNSNNDAAVMASDHAAAFAGYDQQMAGTGSFSQTISETGTFADGNSWSAAASGNILGTKVAFETGASSALAMGINPFGANVAHGAGTHSSSAISNDELGISMANVDAQSNSMTMGNGQAFADAGASAIASNDFVVASGQTSVGASIEGNNIPFILPNVPPNMPPTTPPITPGCKDDKCGDWDKPGDHNLCKDGNCEPDHDFCKDGGCDNWDKPNDHENKDKKCHRHREKDEKPANPEVPVVIEMVTYHVDVVPVVFKTPETKIVINEVNKNCVELYAMNTNRLLDGFTITQKETGNVLLEFNVNDGILVSGDHPVFEWDNAPVNGVLVLKDQFGNILDEFCYIDPGCDESNQRIPDARSIIEVKPATWGEPNPLT